MEFKNSVVVYFRHGCPFCDAIVPSFSDFESSLGEQGINFSTIDTTKDDVNIPIRSVPTIAYFDTDGETTIFKGRRTTEEITAWATELKRSPKSMKKGKTSLVLYHMPGCGYCVNFMPTYDALSFSGVTKTKVNVTTQKGSKEFRKLGVAGVPQVVLTHKGEQHFYEGDRTFDNVTQWVQNVINGSHNIRGGYVAPVTEVASLVETPIQGGASFPFKVYVTKKGEEQLVCIKYEDHVLTLDDEQYFCVVDSNGTKQYYNIPTSAVDTTSAVFATNTNPVSMDRIEAGEAETDAVDNQSIDTFDSSVSDNDTFGDDQSMLSMNTYNWGHLLDKMSFDIK